MDKTFLDSCIAYMQATKHPATGNFCQQHYESITPVISLKTIFCYGVEEKIVINIKRKNKTKLGTYWQRQKNILCSSLFLRNVSEAERIYCVTDRDAQNTSGLRCVGTAILVKEKKAEYSHQSFKNGFAGLA